MLGKRKSEQSESSAVNPNDVSRVAAGTSITGGLLTTSGDIRFDGEFDGRIESTGRVMIAAKSHVKGKIKCAYLDVWGLFEGDACVGEEATLKSGCQFKGALAAKRMVVELGAGFEGTSTRLVEKEA